MIVFNQSLLLLIFGGIKAIIYEKYEHINASFEDLNSQIST